MKDNLNPITYKPKLAQIFSFMKDKGVPLRRDGGLILIAKVSEDHCLEIRCESDILKKLHLPDWERKNFGVLSITEIKEQTCRELNITYKQAELYFDISNKDCDRILKTADEKEFESLLNYYIAEIKKVVDISTIKEMLHI